MRRAAPRLALPRSALLAVAALGACAQATDLGDGIAAIEIRGPSPASVAVGATVRLTAAALDRKGSPVNATFTWRTPDPTIIRVDAGTGDVTGLASGTGRIQASTGSATSTFFTLSVTQPASTP